MNKRASIKTNIFFLNSSVCTFLPHLRQAQKAFNLISIQNTFNALHNTSARTMSDGRNRLVIGCHNTAHHSSPTIQSILYFSKINQEVHLSVRPIWSRTPATLSPVWLSQHVHCWHGPSRLNRSVRSINLSPQASLSLCHQEPKCAAGW